MSKIAQPPKTGIAEFDRWLFLFLKSIETDTTTTTTTPDTGVKTVSYGGTGATNLSGYLRGNGTNPFTASQQIPYTDISGVPTNRGYGSQVDALDNASGTGVYVLTAFGASTVRTMTGTSNRLSITDGDGVAGNPTFDIDSGYVGQNTITTLGTVTTGTWNAGAVTSSKAVIGARVTVTYSTSMTLDASLGNVFEITATDGVAFAINAPTNPVTGQTIIIKIYNTSGGALGVATWNAVFKMVAWVQPADTFNRAILFHYNGTNWTEDFRSAADVTN